MLGARLDVAFVDLFGLVALFGMFFADVLRHFLLQYYIGTETALHLPVSPASSFRCEGFVQFVSHRSLVLRAHESPSHIVQLSVKL